MTRQLLLALAAALACASTAQADSAYPNKPIRLVGGYSPAGAADFIARIVGEALA